MNGNEEGDSRSGGSRNDEQPQMKRRLRHATLYDAVAGRVSARSFIAQPSATHEGGNPAPFSSFALTPEEALFRRQNAPTRYMENDFYFANETLPPELPLPDSDLLKAIHTYSSDFYSHATVDHGRTSWRSMDETALIALGILLEEEAKESLGETGDMVFVEGQEIPDAEAAVSGKTSVTPKPGIRKRPDTASSGPGSGEDDFAGFRQGTRRKRCRVAGHNGSKASDTAGI